MGTFWRASVQPREAAFQLRLDPRLRLPAWLVGIAAFGLLTYHSWLTTLPLSAGDWPWIASDQLHRWFPWPTVWDPEVGFGFKNFSGVYEVPIEAISGALSRLGADWALTEKLLYFWPFAALSFVGPWLLARYLLRSSRWALLSALIFASNTYFLTFSTGGQLFLAVAQAVAPFVLLTFIKSLRTGSFRWALVTGLLLGLQAAYEVRITYLTVILCILIFTVLTIAEPVWRLIAARAGLTALALAVLAGTQMYWLLPLATYKGDPGLPIGASPWLAFMRITHGITAVAPYWTGGPPAIFRNTAVDPSYLVFPLVAFVPLLRRLVRVEVIWLALASLATAFLIKQTNPPAGQIYEWMFFHVPGWNLFREASKLYFIVALAYAVLIPLALQDAFSESRRMDFLRTAAGIAAVLAVSFLSLRNFVPLEIGDLGFTTRPQAEPSSFIAFSRILDEDRQYGPVLWFGGATVFDAPESAHQFLVRSQRHPLVQLLGNGDAGDPLVSFCRAPDVQFCYLDDQLFPYLLKRIGAGYVVAPGGPKIGRLPTLPFSAQPALSYLSLLDRLNSILGPPRLLGVGDEALAVWKLPTEGPPALAARAVGVVHGPSEVTQDALLALEAIGVPAIYQTAQNDGRSNVKLPQAIVVLPRVAGACHVDARGTYVLLASTSGPSLEVSDGNHQISLPLATVPHRLSGWGSYGPLELAEGDHPFITASPTVLGPCIGWSQLTKSLMQDENSPEGFMAQSLQAEHVTARLGIGTAWPWVELRRTFDKGWVLDSARSHMVGDGLFNLYLLAATPETLHFSFSTWPWERIGLALSLVWTAGVLAVCLIVKGSGKGVAAMPAVSDPKPRVIDSIGRYVALTGMLFLAVASVFYALGWYGIPSGLRWLGAYVASAYGESEYYTALAILALILAAILRLASMSFISQRGFTR